MKALTLTAFLLFGSVSTFAADVPGSLLSDLAKTPYYLPVAGPCSKLAKIEIQDNKTIYLMSVYNDSLDTAWINQGEVVTVNDGIGENLVFVSDTIESTVNSFKFFHKIIVGKTYAYTQRTVMNRTVKGFTVDSEFNDGKTTENVVCEYVRRGY